MCSNKCCLVLIFCFVLKYSAAQKEDYNWIMGYASAVKSASDTGIFTLFGNSVLFFNNGSPDTFRYLNGLDFNRTNASISDAEGNLLFYTNGVKVYNKMDILMENGDTLNPARLLFEDEPDMLKNGYRWDQSVIIIKKPLSDSLYYILHVTLEVSDNPSIQLYCKGLYYTLVDISANSGLGKVIQKNVPIIEDSITFVVSICKHANGQDWWLIMQELYTNSYYTVLINAHEIKVLDEKQKFIKSFGEQFTYAPNGNKLVKLSWDRGLDILDFNRCTGKLSNLINIPIPDILDSSLIGTGIAISPNSRFLYVTLTTKVHQYDLEATNIAASKEEICYWDGYGGDEEALKYFPKIPTAFSTPQLGPDGKIYIGTGNSSRVLHVIHNPDKKGKACNIEQHGLRLPTFCLGVPNFPNYRLGAMKCESEIVSIEKEKIKLYPNPVTSYFYIDYGDIDWSGDNEYSISLVNSLGQEVWEKSLPRYSGYQQINMETLVPGVYCLSLKGKQGVILWQEKVIKQD